jgi:hypothetical protein
LLPSRVEACSASHPHMPPPSCEEGDARARPDLDLRPAWSDALPMSGIIAEGYNEYLKAIEAEAKVKLTELQAQLDRERVLSRRTELKGEMKRVRVELASKRKKAAGSLF